MAKKSPEPKSAEFHGKTVRASAAVNHPPVLHDLADRVAHPGQVLSLTVNADDAANDPLTFGLVNPPSGATIHPQNGQFQWQPGWQFKGQTVTITVEVTDSVNAPVQGQFRVSVLNEGPTMDPIPDRTAHPGRMLRFMVNAFDPDGDALTYCVLSGPPGAQISAAGEFTWTPAWADDGQSFLITVRATDPGGLSADRTFTVTVVNQSPTLDAIDDRTVPVGQQCHFFVNASDPDGDNLEYLLLAGPATANLDPVTGEFTWTPAPGDEGSYLCTIRVQDPGGRSADRTFTITAV
jgi:hypothetical protein